MLTSLKEYDREIQDFQNKIRTSDKVVNVSKLDHEKEI